MADEALAEVEGAGSSVNMEVEGTMMNLYLSAMYSRGLQRKGKDDSRDSIEMEPDGREELYARMSLELLRDGLSNGHDADLDPSLRLIIPNPVQYDLSDLLGLQGHIVRGHAVHLEVEVKLFALDNTSPVMQHGAVFQVSGLASVLGIVEGEREPEEDLADLRWTAGRRVGHASMGRHAGR